MKDLQETIQLPFIFYKDTQPQYKILSDLPLRDNSTIENWVGDAINHFAPFSILRRRDPQSYFKLMKAAYELSTHLAYTTTLLASEETSALQGSKSNNKIMIDYYTQESTKILKDLEEKVPEDKSLEIP